MYQHFFSQGKEKKNDIYLNLVMDYIPDTLYKILRYYYKIKYQFPNMLGKIYSYQMFRALAYIHNLSICHRDIKPQNVLVDTKLNRLVLCDFGSAKKLKRGEPNVAYICSRWVESIFGELN